MLDEPALIRDWALEHPNQLRSVSAHKHFTRWVRVRYADGTYTIPKDVFWKTASVELGKVL